MSQAHRQQLLPPFVPPRHPMGRKPQVVVVERMHGMRGFPDGARSSRGRASTKMKACRAAALATALPSRAGTIKSSTCTLFSEQPTRRTSHHRSRVCPGSTRVFLPEPLGNSFFRTPLKRQALATSAVGECSCARVRGASSIHTRLGFMQRRLVKIEIISDTI